MERIRGFDGLRAFAVLAVITSHWELWIRAGLNGEATRLLSSLGVPLFFVLSGFLITSLLLAEQARSGTVDVAGFYMRRALRILPLYFLTLAIFIGLEYAELIRLQACTYVHAFTHTMNFAPKGCVPGSLSHDWSLAVEEHFYAFWPLVFLAGRRIAFIVLLLIIAVCQLALLNDDAVFGAYFATHWTNRWTIPAALPIAIGALAAFYVNSRMTKTPFTSRWAPVVLAAALWLVWRERETMTWYAAIACVLLFIYFNQDSLLTRALEWRPIAYLGTISYGLYVWQGVLGGNGPYREFASFPPPLDIGMALTFVVAPLSYHLFEKPIMRWKKRWGSVALVRPSAPSA